MIIDCHTHIASQMTGFWQPRRYGRIFDHGAERQAFPPAFDPVASPAELLVAYMDSAGVDHAFLVQHHNYGDQNQTVLDAMKRWPGRFSGFAYLGAFDRPDAPDQLERLVEMGMTGLKVELASTLRLRQSFRFDGDVEMRVWERLDQLGRPWILDINEADERDLAGLRTAIGSLKRSRFVICHVGWPANPGWQERALIAKHPRGWMDLASLPHCEGPDARAI